MAVIEKERDAYMARDFSRVEATWKQEPTSRKYYMSAKGLNKRVGWSEIAISDKKNIEKVAESDWDNIQVEYLNFDSTLFRNFKSDECHGIKGIGIILVEYEVCGQFFRIERILS